MTAASQAIDVRYSNLSLADKLNARDAREYTDEEISELAALIKLKGLIQPIVVRNGKHGKLEVYAGKRRYLAIGKLIKSGDWLETQPVPATLRDENDKEALETSLIENVARKPMHPIDEYEAFAAINAKGANPETIAKRYGTTVKIVNQKLALGRLAPEIREAWRTGEINGDTAMAFAVCRDPKQQAQGFKTLQKRGQLWENNVRRFFVKDKPSIDDKRLQLVGLDAYKAAGGKVIPSLFDGDGYVEDGALLKKLTAAAVKAKCEALLAEGWAWAALVDDCGHGHYGWGHLQASKRYTVEERKRLKEIKAEQEEMEQVLDPGRDDAWEARSETLEEEIAGIDEAATSRAFTAEQKAKAGCILHVGPGEFRIDYGRVKNVSQSKLDKQREKKKAAAKAVAAGEEPPADAEISNALRGDITGWQTKAVAEALAQCPALAIRMAAAALAPSRGYASSPVRLQVDGMMRHANLSGLSGDAEDDDDDDDDVQQSKSGFADAFAAIDAKNAAKALAVNLGRALDLRQLPYKSVPQADVDAVLGELPADIYLAAMRKAFDAEDYFTRASAKIATAALKEMGLDAPSGGKAAEHKAVAAAEARERGWLPPEIRHPGYALLAPGAKPAKKKAKRVS